MRSIFELLRQVDLVRGKVRRVESQTRFMSVVAERVCAEITRRTSRRRAHS